MKRLGLLIALLAGLVFALQPLPAQDEKKADAKDPEKKSEKKKDKSAKDKKPIEKMPVFGARFVTKVMSANGASNREFTVEFHELDPKKVYDFNVWQAQQSQSLGQAQLQVARANTPQALLSATQNYQRAMGSYNLEMARRQSNLTTAKPLEIRAAEDAKVRTLFLPIIFDDQGFAKKWTEKERKEFRGETQLPGYPSDFDAIKSGQIVEIFMVKKAPPVKDKDAPKKKKTDDDPPPMVTPEFILIVIRQEGAIK